MQDMVWRSILMFPCSHEWIFGVDRAVAPSQVFFNVNLLVICSTGCVSSAVRAVMHFRLLEES
jgi:hypothetical protein